MDNGAGVVGGNLHRGVGRAGGGATENDGSFQPLTFHFLGDVDHFIQRWGDES